MKQGYANLTQLAAFDEIIDARSPAEYAEDHLPGAVNCPALDDAERARVGTLYKQDSPFTAKKVGAALVARNIARHLEESFAGRGRDWRPLVYCWRGGKRSGAFVTVFRQIGWDAAQLEGGYKAYRRHIVGELASLPRRLRYRVVSGATGSGKSRLLHALAAQGAQVLDLEALAVHKGSVLGALPDAPQPAQKMFESRLYQALAALDPAREVFVEAESRRIGVVQLPDALIEAMRESPCLRVEATLAARVRFLLGDYDYFLRDVAGISAKLACLRELRGAETVARWIGHAEAGRWEALVGELLTEHYDPLYHRSQGKNYLRYAEAPLLATDDLSGAALTRLAADILAAPR